MHSFLLIGPDPQQQQDYILDFCEKEQIGKFDQTQCTTEESSFGIQNVRDMQKVAMRKPLRGNKKALIIPQAELLTPDAQNALLKLLEEPPLGTFLFLCAPTDTSFLSTVVSRCKVVALGTKNAASEEMKAEFEEILQKIEQGSLGNTLALAETLAGKKGDLQDILSGLLEVGRETLLKDPTDIRLAQVLKTLQQASHVLYTTNVAPRMVLEHALLTI